MGHFQSLLKLKTALILTLVLNVILFLMKFFTGIIFNANALWIDGLNSLTDTFISLIVLIMVLISAKKPDHDHHYGHEKYEGLAYFLLGIIFLLTSFYLIYINLVSLFNLSVGSSNENILLTLIMSIISLILKLILVIYLRVVMKKTKHPLIAADYKNHVYDVFSIIFVTVSIALSQTEFYYIDYIVSILIAFFILKLSIQMLIESTSFLTDQAPSKDEIESIYQIILSHPDVLQIDDLKVRKHMYKRYVDVEIGVLESLSLKQSHAIAEKVHDDVEFHFRDVIHCMVHVNPTIKKTP